jgi:DNA-binding NarL/FixJ family response regulator
MNTLIIEDDPLWGDFIAETVKSYSGCALVGLAKTGHEGLVLLSALSPDLLILDLRLPDIDGLQMIDRISRDGLCPKIMIVTSRVGDAVMARLFSFPVVGMIWKTANAKELLVQGISAISQGKVFYSEEARNAWSRFRSAPDSYLKILTDTEIKLVGLFAEGMSDADVAACMGCKSSTAHSHRKNIMSKLGLHSQIEMQRWATEKSLIAPIFPAPPCIVGRMIQ